MLALSSIRYAKMKFNAWNAPKPTAKPITIFFGNERLFHHDRVFFDVVPHEEQ